MVTGAAHLIEMNDLAVGYDRHVVVDAITASLAPGQLMVLMGTNGSGKSTILRTLAGLIEPVAGECSVLGAWPGTNAARVAYLPQHPASLATLPLRARDVVSMGRYPLLGLFGRSGAADREAVEDAMTRMSVTVFGDKPLHALSGGQQQRVHLAQVLSRRADVLLLDEPTAGLDAQGRKAVARMVEEERAAGRCVVMATHDLVDAEPADTVLLLAHRLIAHGSPGETLTDANLRACYGFTDRH
ncbi:MAG: metal ABC transporter ATP-binding protein [Actinomycetota bacterium]